MKRGNLESFSSFSTFRHSLAGFDWRAYVIRCTFLPRARFTPHSGPLSASLKRTFKFFPKQFFSPPLFYISMPVPRGIKSHAINSIFMQSTLCSDITFSPWWWNTNIYVNSDSERGKEPPSRWIRWFNVHVRLPNAYITTVWREILGSGKKQAYIYG